MALVLHIACAGHDHRIALDRDGSVEALDHNKKTLKAFKAFDATAPACVQRAQALEEAINDADADVVLNTIIRSVVNNSARSTEKLLQRDFAKLAFEYADRVVNLAIHTHDLYEELDEDKTPIELVTALGEFAEGGSEKLLEAELKRTRAQRDVASIESPYSGIDSVFSCAIHAAQAALLANPSLAADELLITAELSRDFVIDEQMDASLDDESEIIMDEVAWQMRQAIDILENYGGRL